jgi:glycosyltransferase involved in cell wall biosynthesis
VKVLHITTHMNIGGIANYILTLGRELEKRRVEVTVVSSGGDLEADLRNGGIRHRHLDIRTKFEFHPKVFAAAFGLAGIIKEEDIDIVHAHTRVSQVAACLSSTITRVPYITTCHGYFRKRARGIFDTWGAKVIAISDAVKTHLENDLGVEGSRIEVIYNGVDTGRYSTVYSSRELGEIKRSLGLGEGPVIGTIGRLSPVKGHDILIRAMKAVTAEWPDVQCLIVGSGGEEAKLKALARSLFGEKTIRFAGPDLGTHRFLSVMDVFVFPSLKEGLGIALLEALAAGRACVASNIGGIGDIIKDGSNGILVPVGDTKSMAKAVVRLLSDKALRDRMGEDGKALVNKNFSIGSMADKVAALYRRIAAGKG